MAKTKKMNWKSKKTWKNILIIGLSIIVFVGAIACLCALFKRSEETTKEINPSFSVGGLTENGAYLETEKSIYTKDAFECDGLEIIPDFESTITYRVFYYNYNYEFISSTAKQDDKYSDLKPTLAKYARIVITPNDDTKISWYEIGKYSRQLTIRVYKDQTFVLPNLFVVDEDNLYKFCGDSGKGTELTYTDSELHGVAKAIDCTGIKSFVFRFDEDDIDYTYSYFYFTSENISIKSGRTVAGVLEYVVEVPDGAKWLYCNYIIGHEYVINQYA